MELGWYAESYKLDTYRDGQKATCRWCGEEIVFRVDSAKTTTQKGAWLHLNITQENLPNIHEISGHVAQPKEFCCERMGAQSAYNVCGLPVKFEDREQGRFACGRHMKIFEEEQTRRRKSEERAAKEKADKELEQYEMPFYVEAEAWLREHLGDELFDEQHSTKDRYRWRNDGEKTIDRMVRVDWYVLKQQIERRFAGDHSTEVRTDEHVADNQSVLPWDD